MICQRFRRRTENGLAEWSEISLGREETRVVIDALEYYTEKRRLDFKNRMLSGDMARIIKDCEIKVFDEEVRDGNNP